MNEVKDDMKLMNEYTTWHEEGDGKLEYVCRIILGKQENPEEYQENPDIARYNIIL